MLSACFGSNGLSWSYQIVKGKQREGMWRCRWRACPSLPWSWQPSRPRQRVRRRPQQRRGPGSSPSTSHPSSLSSHTARTGQCEALPCSVLQFRVCCTLWQGPAYGVRHFWKKTSASQSLDSIASSNPACKDSYCRRHGAWLTAHTGAASHA